MDDRKPKLIVALDVEKLEDAERLVKALYPVVTLFKIGSQLFTAYGPESVWKVGLWGGKVFLDLKFHDIPNTVGNAVAVGTSVSSPSWSESMALETQIIQKEIREGLKYPVFMMTVHTAGGEQMMRAAVDAAGKRAAEFKIEKPKIVGITVLTSDAFAGDVLQTVVNRALSAQEAGLDGVVCSVREAVAVRRACGEEFIIVTPGIRSNDATTDDQKRTATAAEAAAAGSNFLVVGRPIVKARDPLRAAQEILTDLKKT